MGGASRDGQETEATVCLDETGEARGKRDERCDALKHRDARKVFWSFQATEERVALGILTTEKTTRSCS